MVLATKQVLPAGPPQPAGFGPPVHIRPPTRVDRPDAPASRWRRSRKRLLRPMVVASLAVHLLLLGLVLLWPLPPPGAPPASSFDLVMGGGEPASAPNQTLDPAPPATEAPAPQHAPPRVEIPMPDFAEPLPLPPIPPPLSPPAPLQLSPPPRPRPLARAAPRNPSGFPAPQNWSFSGGLTSRLPLPGAPGQALNYGPMVAAPHITGADLGPDWGKAYSEWVREHLYYPEQAAANGEDGTAEVIMTIDRNGKVLTLEMVTRSGSQWLDLSTMALFRGAHVPRFPPGANGDVVTVDQTIHYILQRR